MLHEAISQFATHLSLWVVAQVFTLHLALLYLPAGELHRSG